MAKTRRKGGFLENIRVYLSGPMDFVASRYGRGQAIVIKYWLWGYSGGDTYRIFREIGYVPPEKPKAVLARCEWGHDDYSLRIEKMLKAPPKPGQMELRL